MIRLGLLALPTSTNHLHGRGKSGVIINERARRATEASGWEARAANRGEPFEGALEVKIALWWPDKRKHDVNNTKPLLDALTGILWLRGGQIEDPRIRNGFHKHKPRVEIEAAPLYESAAEGERIPFSV